ncbi:MAG: tetratricopeptide repeat protein, partial [Euryarchaeota archaeon]|nr:tetratricopeptide repeat protein [Euryarchaeota archaeon]
MERGEYDEARNKFETVLEMKQQIGDKAGMAATLHRLATIDMERGEYDEARNKFEKALKIKQQIGDKAGV